LTSSINARVGPLLLEKTSVKRKEARVVAASVGSIARIADDRSHVAKTLAHPHVRRGLQDVVRPKSLASGMRNVGVALILCPDPLGPIVDIPGVALLASSYVARRKEPTNAKNVVIEARKLLRDMESLRL
jgi:hypothetical protein